MHLNSIMTEFQEIISVAQEILLEKETQDLTIEQFIQLCVDIRAAERSDVDLNGKNIVLFERNVLQ